VSDGEGKIISKKTQRTLPSSANDWKLFMEYNDHLWEMKVTN
jgi:hypothetical protein